ncbi:MAG: GNAT family N-acetyltransferase [Clostridiales bacterium]|nr:GNAT family N-acetyltransferase [Clostridiales bacterium]
MKICKVISKSQIQRVADLAREIWHEHYIPIIGIKQVNYMIANFQSIDAITGQIEDGYKYYLVKYQGQYAGYFAILNDIKNSHMFLSKLYIHKNFRALGLARSCVIYMEDICRELNLTTIWLTVNKYNDIAIKAYLSMGFVNVESITQDIGNGFIMDDYRMEKKI